MRIYHTQVASSSNELNMFVISSVYVVFTGFFLHMDTNSAVDFPDYVRDLVLGRTRSGDQLPPKHMPRRVDYIVFLHPWSLFPGTVD